MYEVFLSAEGTQGADPDERAPERGTQGMDLQVPLLRSSVIPGDFRHGFTTRRGGVSGPPFDTLNLGSKWGDRSDNVAENRRRLVALSGAGRIFFAAQVHGADSVLAEPDSDPSDVARVQADAVIAPQAGVAVGIYVADCVPILIADTRSGVCAAVHAGWRGTVRGVLSATLRRMVSQCGCDVADLRVAVGPSIGPCCFEVGPEVVAAVEAASPGARAAGAIIDGAAGARSHVDLWMLNRMAAASVGVATEAIEVAAECTYCQPARFFSYRRDHGNSGQLAAFIVRDQEPAKTTP